MPHINAAVDTFDQLVHPSFQWDILFEMTLSYPLGPTTWSIETADEIPVNAELLHYIKSTTSRPTQPNKQM